MGGVLLLRFKQVHLILLSILLISTNAFTKEFSKETSFTVIDLDIDYLGVEKVSDNFYVAWISEEPKMPSIKARLSPQGLKGHVSWEFSIDYKYNYLKWVNEQQVSVERSYSINQLKHTTKNNEEWDINKILGKYFFGGTVTLVWEYIDENNMRLPRKTFVFYIRGKTPNVNDVKQYIDITIPNYWYAKCIASHESLGYHQFEFRSSYVFGPTGKRYLPLVSSDGGVGIYQITSEPVTGDDHYSWKENINKGKSFLDSKRTDALRWVKKQLEQAYIACKSDMKIMKEKMNDISITYNGVTFEFGDWTYDEKENEWKYNETQSKKTFLDATSIKSFNGSSKPKTEKGESGYFIDWYNNEWLLHELNSLNFNYVKRVCEEYPQ